MKRCLIAPLSFFLAGLIYVAPARGQAPDVDDSPPPPTQDAANDVASDSTNPGDPNRDDNEQDEATSADRQTRDTTEAYNDTAPPAPSNPDSQRNATNNQRQREQGSRDADDRQQDQDDDRAEDRDDEQAYDRGDREPRDEARSQDESGRDRRDGRRGVQADAQAEINVQSAGDLGLELEEEDNGLSITNIERNSVLVQSGFQPGDIIVSAQDRPIRTSRDFVRWFRGIDRQGNVPVVVMRDGRRQTIYLAGDDIWRWYDRGDDAWPGENRGQLPYLGVVFDDRYPRLAMVEVVRRGTAADRAGLRPGDVIQRINGQRVYGLRHASQLVSDMRPGDEIELEYSRRTTARSNATLGGRPDGRQTAYSDEYGSGLAPYDAEYADRYSEPNASDGMRTSYEDSDEFGERGIRERDGLLRRGASRPIRNP